MSPLIPVILDGLVSGVKSFFSVRESKVNAIVKLMDVATSIDTNDIEAKKAASAAIVAEASSGYWLSACWRPIVSLFFASLVGARFLGYHAPGMSEREIMELYELVKICIGGYMGGRTVEKVIGTLNLGQLIKSMTK